MQPTGQQDYKQLLTQVIKKQIIILGPDITLAKARNVPGLVVADDGSVTDISGDPQQLTQKLVDQFVQLSGEIVKKTMEPLLTMNQTPLQQQPMTNNQVSTGVTQSMPTPTPQPAPTPSVPPQPVVSSQPAQSNVSVDNTKSA